MLTFLIGSAAYQLSNYPIVPIMLGRSYSRPNLLINAFKMYTLGIKARTSG